MGKCYRKEIVKLVSVSDFEGNPIDDWRGEFVNTVGLLGIFKSERKAPGKQYLCYFPNEPEEVTQRYFHTSVGILTEEDNMIYLEGNHIYKFEVGDFISDNDYMALLLNAGLEI